MPGLLNSTAMTPPGQAMGGQPQGMTSQPPTVEAGMGEQASPEQQAQYDEVVGRGLLLIFDEKKGQVRKAVADLLKGGEPKEAITMATATIYERVASEARQAGQQIDPEVRDAAIAEIFEMLAEIGQSVVGEEFLASEDDFHGAYFAAVDQVRLMETEAGGVDQEAEMNRFSQLSQQHDMQHRGV